MKKLVLAYSGGLDTSAMLHWIKQTYGCEVITFCADLGQAEELDGLEEKALKTGASKLYVRDLRKEFIEDYVWTALKANATYEGIYLMGTSLARPIIAKHQVEIARLEGADAVGHGATGKGNDQVRFELTFSALAPDLKIVAPWRDWEFKGRSDLIAYSRKHDIPVTVTAEKPYSMDRNIVHISYEGGILEDPWAAAPEEIFKLTRSPKNSKPQADELTIRFDRGIPVAINGKERGSVELLTELNLLGGEHGIGRVDLVENRFVGMKSRGVYETPGLTILMHAHRALESITMDREVMRVRDTLGTKIAELIYNGFWFSPEFSLLQKTIDETQKHVTGDVRLELYRGNITTLGRRSEYSLYQSKLASFEAENVYRQKDAEGFIRLNGLRLRSYSALHPWAGSQKR